MWRRHRSQSSALKSLTLLLCVLLSPPVHADRVKVLYHDAEASQARVDLIRQAKSELFVSYFVVRDDAASMSGFVLLLDAADRGVKVRVIVDSFHLDVGLPYLKALTAHPNIDIRVYNRVNLFHLLRAFKRSHEKIILADNIHTGAYNYLTGGRNVSDKYFGFGEKRNFNDLDIYVHGDSARLARDAYFLELWDSKLVSNLSLGPFSDANMTERRCLQAKKDDDFCTRKVAQHRAAYARAQREIADRRRVMVAGEASGVDWDLNRRWDLAAHETGEVRFLFDPPHDRKTDRGIATDIYDIIVSDESIRKMVILSPYVILTRRGARMLKILRRRGVEITLVTNSLDSTDNLLAQAGYANDRQWLLEQGIRIHHYIGPDTMHAKAIVINDGESALIGSYNFDPRSASLNREVGAHFRPANDSDHGLTGEIQDMVAYYLDRSRAMGEDGIPLGFDQAHPEAPKWKKVVLGILQPLVAIPLIRKNL